MAPEALQNIAGRNGCDTTSFRILSLEIDRSTTPREESDLSVRQSYAEVTLGDPWNTIVRTVVLLNDPVPMNRRPRC